MIAQIGIALTGVVAIFLSQSKEEQRRKWACVFGLLGQPFWMYAAWTSEQWGVFAMTFLYTLAWTNGLYTNWIKVKGDV